MSLALSMPQFYKRTSVPMLLFPDDRCRALRLFLKQYYLSDSSSNTYMIKVGEEWIIVPKSIWIESIREVSDDTDPTPIIPSLENREACRRILIDNDRL